MARLSSLPASSPHSSTAASCTTCPGSAARRSRRPSRNSPGSPRASTGSCCTSFFSRGRLSPRPASAGGSPSRIRVIRSSPTWINLWSFSVFSASPSISARWTDSRSRSCSSCCLPRCGSTCVSSPGSPPRSTTRRSRNSWPPPPRGTRSSAASPRSRRTPDSAGAFGSSRLDRIAFRDRSGGSHCRPLGSDRVASCDRRKRARLLGRRDCRPGRFNRRRTGFPESRVAVAGRAAPRRSRRPVLVLPRLRLRRVGALGGLRRRLPPGLHREEAPRARALLLQPPCRGDGGARHRPGWDPVSPCVGGDVASLVFPRHVRKRARGGPTRGDDLPRRLAARRRLPLRPVRGALPRRLDLRLRRLRRGGARGRAREHVLLARARGGRHEGRGLARAHLAPRRAPGRAEPRLGFDVGRDDQDGNLRAAPRSDVSRPAPGMVGSRRHRHRRGFGSGRRPSRPGSPRLAAPSRLPQRREHRHHRSRDRRGAARVQPPQSLDRVPGIRRCPAARLEPRALQGHPLRGRRQRAPRHRDARHRVAGRALPPHAGDGGGVSPRFGRDLRPAAVERLRQRVADLIWRLPVRASASLPHAWAVAALAAVPALALIGGLAAACFVKAFGVVFLGEPRSEAASKAHEAGAAMRTSMILGSLLCISIGIWPAAAIRLVAPEATVIGRLPSVPMAAVGPLSAITRLAVLLLALVTLLTLLRRALLRGRSVATATTWGCGYPGATARMQYTAASFAEPVLEPFAAAIPRRIHQEGPEGYFPAKAHYEQHLGDMAGERFLLPATRRAVEALSRLKVIQQGRLQLYLVYIAVTLVVLLVWQLAGR